MLYFKALFDGLDDLPPADPAVRAALEARARANGWPALHAELAAVDPVTSARLAPNDSQRIQRALEVQRLSGQPISAGQRATTPEHGLRLQRWALVPGDRAALAQRIADDVTVVLSGEGGDELFAGYDQHHLALKPELAADRDKLFTHFFLLSSNDLKANELMREKEHLSGLVGLDAAVERAKAATRQLARRQLTWIRADADWRSVDPLLPGAREQWLEAVVATLRQRGPAPG
jgi:tRNA dimethylallyltransferase